jgi:FMN phosphatase YigB (HAD superfamily)
MLRDRWKAAAWRRHAMRPEFVYFDLGNVIFSFDRPRGFRQMAAVCGAPADLIEQVVMAGGLQEELEQGDCDWAGFHAEFSRRTGTTSDAEALARAASDMFALRVETLPVIAALERIGCPIGILSNTCGPHWRQIVESRCAILPGGFREIVLSHEIGAAKPAAAIYATAAHRAAVPAERIFFCDDTPGHVAAARAAGWDAEVFTSAAGLVDALARRGLNLGL